MPTHLASMSIAIAWLAAGHAHKPSLPCPLHWHMASVTVSGLSLSMLRHDAKKARQTY